jgi:hypothetical protein
MAYTNAEVAFLARGGDNRGGRGMTRLDSEMFRTCPPRIMNRILEARAKRLGSEFAAFQEEQRRLSQPNAPFDLEQQVQSTKLF